MKKKDKILFAESIFEIDLSFFQSHGFKYIFCDLDNTLDSFKCSLPSKNVIDYVNFLRQNNIELIIISNNSEKRVDMYCKQLSISYLSRSGKPFTGKINKYIKKMNLNKDEIVFIGDQLLTDIKCAKRLGVECVLTNKIVSEDQWNTKINRFFEKGPRKRLEKKDRLIKI